MSQNVAVYSYEPVSGRLGWNMSLVVVLPLNPNLIIAEGWMVAEGVADIETQRHDVVNNVLVDKVVLPFIFDGLPITADGMDSAVFSNLPAGTIVRYPLGVGGDFASDVVDDGVFQFSIDVVGSFDLVFSNPLYLDVVVQVVTQ